MTKARDLANGGFGLVLVKPSSVVGGTDNGKGTVSFSGVSTVSLNDVFNSTYTNYKVVANYIGGQTSGYGTRLRLRVSGSDNSNNSYKTSGFGIADLTSNNIYKNQSNGSISYIDAGNASSNGYSYLIYDILNPFKSQKTAFSINDTYLESDGRWFYNSRSGLFDGTTSFTGFTLYTATSTVTGTISVYGYNE